MSLTVACVWVQGHVPFTPLYVIRLQSMVSRYLKRPHRFVCLTDRGRILYRQESIPIQRPLGCKGWWAKLELFKPGRFTGRVLYLDLDTVIVNDLDPIVDFPADFALIPDAGNWQGLYGLKVVKRFNSSVMVWDAGVNEQLYTTWTRPEARRLWGDQDWIGEQMPHAAQMPLAWFPRVSELKEERPKKDAKVVLCKHPKNDKAVYAYPWVREAWQ